MYFKGLASLIQIILRNEYFLVPLSLELQIPLCTGPREESEESSEKHKIGDRGDWNEKKDQGNLQTSAGGVWALALRSVPVRRIAPG